MVSMTSILALILVVTVAYAQRSPYIRGPWDQMFVGFQGLRDGNQVGSTGGAPAQAQNPSTTTARPGGSRLRLLAGDGDISSESNRLFRFYDNIPIQGPEEPCVGCNYRLTNRGFIRLP